MGFSAIFSVRFWKPTLRKTRPKTRLSQFAQFFLIYFLTFFHWVVITLRQDEGWVQKAMIKEDKTRGSCTNHVDIWVEGGYSKNQILLLKYYSVYNILITAILCLNKYQCCWIFVCNLEDLYFFLLIFWNSIIWSK